MKIVILDGFASNPGDLSWDRLAKLGELTIYDRTSVEQAVERMQGAKIVLANKVSMDGALFWQCPELELLSVIATGYDNIDIAAAKEHGVMVCNVPAYGTDSVAQHTIALLLEICSRAGLHNAGVHSGRWEAAPDYCYWDQPLIELAGKTMGIIGFGQIGKKVAALSVALGMKVLYNSRTRYPEQETEHIKYASLNTLLAQSDVVSLHCPLTPKTAALINSGSIAKMKDGAILLNVARGKVIDERAVADALDAGKLYAAGVDVLSSEPPTSDNPLLHAKNCVITPHIAWAPRESRARLVGITCDNVEAYISGSPQNVVNP